MFRERPGFSEFESLEGAENIQPEGGKKAEPDEAKQVAPRRNFLKGAGAVLVAGALLETGALAGDKRKEQKKDNSEAGSERPERPQANVLVEVVGIENPEIIAREIKGLVGEWADGHRKAVNPNTPPLKLRFDSAAVRNERDSQVAQRATSEAANAADRQVSATGSISTGNTYGDSAVQIGREIFRSIVRSKAEKTARKVAGYPQGEIALTYSVEFQAGQSPQPRAEVQPRTATIYYEQRGATGKPKYVFTALVDGGKRLDVPAGTKFEGYSYSPDFKQKVAQLLVELSVDEGLTPDTDKLGLAKDFENYANEAIKPKVMGRGAPAPRTAPNMAPNLDQRRVRPRP